MTRRWVAHWMRRLADRLSPETAWRRTHWRFHFKDHVGAVFTEHGEGCPLWYRTQDYDQAHQVTGHASFDNLGHVRKT